MKDPINLLELGGVKIFEIRTANPQYALVTGGVYEKTSQRWLFPAYPPFGLQVYEDLQKLGKTRDTPAVMVYVNEFLRVVDTLPLPTRPFITTPFQHQEEGVRKLFYSPRFALFWEMGCGKSKTIVDLKLLLPNDKMLIVAPRVVVANWAEQFKIHSGGTVRVGLIRGAVPDKIKIIENWRDYDVLVTSYGTLRNLAVPRLSKRARIALKERLKTVELTAAATTRVMDALTAVSNPEHQLAGIDVVLQNTKNPPNLNPGGSPQWLRDIDFRIIVADESHYMKEVTSQQTQVLLALAKKAGRRYVMSGSPTAGDPRHLYPQLKFLLPSLCEDKQTFEKKFLQYDRVQRKLVVGYKNLGILNARVDKISDRKRKEDCLDLPSRTIIDVPFELSVEQARAYNTMLDEMQLNLQIFEDASPNSYLEIQNKAVLVGKLSQVGSGFIYEGGSKDKKICDGCEHVYTCVSDDIQPYTRRCRVVQKPPEKTVKTFKQNPKLEVLLHLMQDILEDPTHKVIVWCEHTYEITMLAGQFAGLGVEYVTVDGGSSDAEESRNKFNNDPAVRIYLAQSSTGIGITLNAASYAIYFALSWSLLVYQQSIDRNYRIGQTRNCTVYRLIAKGTIDEYKRELLNFKKDVSAILTEKILCSTCDQSTVCLPKNVQPFSTGCKYPRNVAKLKHTPKRIPLPQVDDEADS